MTARTFINPSFSAILIINHRQAACITGHFSCVTFELQSAIKIELKSVLAYFTYWVLPYRMVETSLNGLHKLHAITILFICRGLLGKSGRSVFAGAVLFSLRVCGEVQHHFVRNKGEEADYDLRLGCLGVIESV